MDSIGLKKYKNPYCNQYVAPYGYSFYYNGECLGRIIWRREKEIDGYYIDKIEENGRLQETNTNN